MGPHAHGKSLYCSDSDWLLWFHAGYSTSLCLSFLACETGRIIPLMSTCVVQYCTGVGLLWGWNVIMHGKRLAQGQVYGKLPKWTDAGRWQCEEDRGNVYKIMGIGRASFENSSTPSLLFTLETWIHQASICAWNLGLTCVEQAIIFQQARCKCQSISHN